MGAASTSPSANSKSDTVIEKEELIRLVVQMMTHGLVVLAATYAVKIEDDLCPLLRKFVPDSEVEEYKELLEELR